MGNKEPIMIHIVKETLTEKLDKTKNPSLAVHSVFGWYFPNLFILTKNGHWKIVSKYSCRMG
jgi:hypothetical protein